MPLEAGTQMNVGIRPIERPQSAGGPDRIGQRTGGSAAEAFSPRTNVALQAAVDDMAGILAKIASAQSEAMENMPKELQEVIRNVLKQAFSFEETLGQGLSSTVESQRFTAEQLTSMSRMLNQMAALAEKGTAPAVSDTLQVLLTNLKSMVSNGSADSKILEPVLLLKASFDMLIDRNFDDLPQEMQQLLLSLQPKGQPSIMPFEEGSTLGFLKQLVQFFMPRPATPEGQGQAQQAPQQEQAQGNQQGQNAQQGQAQGTTQGQNTQQGQMTQQGQTTQQGQMSQPGQAQPQGQTQGVPHGEVPGQSQNQPQQSGQSQNAPGQSQANQGQNASQNQSSLAQQGQSASQGGQAAPQGQAQGQTQLQGSQSQQGQNAQGQAQGTPQGQNAPQGQAVAQQGQSGNTQGQNAATSQQGQGTSQSQQGSNAQGQQGTQQPLQQEGVFQQQFRMQPQRGQLTQPNAPQQEAMQQAKSQLMSQTMENTPQTMETMKNLAQLLLKNSQLTQRDAQLLQNFVNGRQTNMGEQEARQLQQLIRLCQQNVPVTVQQAALQQNIPDLPRLYAFMQLCDMANTRQMTAKQLKSAGRDVAAFVLAMRGSMSGDNSMVQGQRSLSFMMPMYLGENEQSYPSYIHVYDEAQQDPETGYYKKETWLRLCVLTENIGAVELTCRVFDDNQLDMRLFFSDSAIADEFRASMQDIRQALRGSENLQLNELKVGAVGERRFI